MFSFCTVKIEYLFNLALPYNVKRLFNSFIYNEEKIIYRSYVIEIYLPQSYDKKPEMCSNHVKKCVYHRLFTYYSRETQCLEYNWREELK